MLLFKNAATLAKFNTDWNTDPVVHVPGGKKGNGWKGKLSDIPVEHAERLIDMNSNLVKLKSATAKEKGDNKIDKKKKDAEEDSILPVQ